MNATDEELLTLTYDDEPGRVIRVRVEGPSGYREAGRALPHVLVVHGFKGFMHWGFFPELSRRVAQAELVAVSLNVSGSGIGEDLVSFTEDEAFAENTYSRELEDVARVCAWVRSGELAAVDPGRAGLFGHSRGGGVPPCAWTTGTMWC